MAQLARHLDFSEAAAGRAALVVSELATNLVKHARGGEMLLRALPATDGTGQQGLEVVAIDRGPGIRDVALSSRDGHSTAGTLGHGLGAVGRQADFFDVYTQPSGTLAVARIWDRQPPPASTGPRYLVGSVNVPKPGEDVCGDQWAWRLRDDRLAILLADGLGHGLLAHEAARAAVRVFEEAHEQSPGRVIDDIHAALRPTRGAAVAMLAVDTSRGTGSYCGLGNIASAILLASGARTSFVSQNGTAGHSTPRVQEFHYAVPSGSIIVMASDGLGTSWDLSAYPGLGARDPSLIAAALYRDFSRRRDDVTVVVARERQRAEHFFAHRL
jgi:anti-sigma regulatory factor (Ser/Thr protein kinase)